jgi:hypothetical protein
MASGGRDDDRSTGARPTASTSFSASSGYSAKETGGDARDAFESPRQVGETSQALLDEVRWKNAARFGVEAPSGPEQGQGPAAETIPTEGATETAAEAQPQVRRAKAKPIAGVPGIWMFFVDPEENSDWLPTLAPQDVIFFWGGKVASGAPYNTLVRAGDTVLVLAGDRFVASGVLGGGSLRTFVDAQGRRRWPVRMIDVFTPPLDRADFGDAGRALV